MVDDAGFQRLLRLIASGDEPQVRGLLARPTWSCLVSGRRMEPRARTRSGTSSRMSGTTCYAGDTALHIAAAGYRHQLAGELVDRGANVRAVNRRGATPLHYAVGGVPGSTRWDPDAQAATIARLIEAGADPEAADKSGVAPLHVAVRSRCAAAVQALLVGGADPAAQEQERFHAPSSGRADHRPGRQRQRRSEGAAGRRRRCAHPSRCKSDRQERARRTVAQLRARHGSCRAPALTRIRLRVGAVRGWIDVARDLTHRTGAGDDRCADRPTAATPHATSPQKSDAWPRRHQSAGWRAASSSPKAPRRPP